MPEISRFLGIVVGVLYNERGRPHFHAVYGEHTITVDIDSLEVHGRFPPRARLLFLEWAVAHRQELRDCWHRARFGLPLPRIDPLE